MGLTIHYDLQSQARSDEKARRLVEQMRQLALDLPFEEVSKIITLEGNQCNFERQRGKVDESRFWLLIQGSQHLRCPWNPRINLTVPPTRLIAFHTIPGPGSEPANLGLCRYPREVELQYRPADDQRFQEKFHPHGPSSTSWRFSWGKWEQWLRRHGHKTYLLPEDEQFVEVRRVRTGLNGWRWSSFCKTQYASDPCCGGIANFLRCHISVVTLLDRIAKLPGVTVQINDEGAYGRSYYSDDWREAHAESREPTYRWHDGKYDPKALAEEVGEWNGMIAAFNGALSDVLKGSGMEAHSPIQSFPDFEQLEFRGSQDENLRPFLQAMTELAERERAKHPGERP